LSINNLSLQLNYFILKKYLIILLFLFPIFSFSQARFNITGTVKDANSGETLLGANVYIKENLHGSSTDETGKYVLNEIQGNYTLICSYLGYQDHSQKINLNKDLKININLISSSVSLESIEIKATREDRNVQSTQVGAIELEMKRVESIPVIFGETDILKTIQLLPGIQSGGEGSNTFYVRGGGSDQNLITIDGATVYNPSHAAGFFSIFNADVINTAEIYKGGLAPEYGGRMSSVLNITTLDGDKEKYKGKVGIGLLSSHIQAEGPIKKSSSSFMLAARRTYADIIMKPFAKGTDFEGIGCYFYDINGKLSIKLSPKDNLYITGYYGKDLLSFGSDTKSYSYDMNWSNGIGAIRWNHFFNNNLTMNVSATLSDYVLNMEAGEDAYAMSMFSGIRDYGVSTDITWQVDSLHKLKFGASYTYHIFKPSALEASSVDTDFDLGDVKNYYARDIAIFAQHEWEINSWLKVLYGIRYNYFAQIGPFTRYEIDNIYDFNNLDSTFYKRGETVYPYHLFEPRINFRFQIDKTKSIKASYTINQQCVNLLAMSEMALPTDVWYPATEYIKPQLAHQVSLGYFQNFLDNALETSVEIYYKKMYNLLELNPEANVTNAMKSNSDYIFVTGEGQSYGIELFANKTVGKFTGWVGYTLGWTTRNFDAIMDGKTFYARYDRRHDVSILLNYELNDKWNFSTVWVFSSGNASTIPNSFYFINGNIIIEYGEHNAWRMPNYHRLDLSANWKVKETRKVVYNLNFSVYNTYSRKNPYFISYTTSSNSETGVLQMKAYQISIFPILPSIAFNVQFK
jgi:hypothetical protein